MGGATADKATATSAGVVGVGFTAILGKGPDSANSSHSSCSISLFFSSSSVETGREEEEEGEEGSMLFPTLVVLVS